MKAVKNLFVIIGLVGVGYGLFVVLNTRKDDPKDQSIQHLLDDLPSVSMGSPGELVDGVPVSPDSSAPAEWDSGSPAPFGPAVEVTETKTPDASSAPPFSGTPSPGVDSPEQLKSRNSEPDLGEQVEATSPPPQTRRQFTEPFHPQGRFGQDWTDSVAHCKRGEYAQALDILSEWHPVVSSRPLGRLSPDEMDHLEAMLDHLAYKVFYSPDSYTDQPYRTIQGDTLESIVAQENYKVPWQLIGRINGIEGKRYLTPGTELKVLSGPFRAIVSKEKSEMTLIHSGRYAARFPVRIGFGFMPTTIDHEVKEKLEPGSAINGFQCHLLNLGSGFYICSAPNQGSRRPDPGKTIFLSPEDMEDVFMILSRHSEISIIR